MKIRTLLLGILASAACLSLASCTHQPEDHTLQLESEEDLSGLCVVTVNGSYYAKKLSERTDIDLLLFTFEADALQALVLGKADVLVQDETILNSELRKEYGVRIAFKGEEHFPTALMFQKGDVALAKAMDAVQDSLQRCGALDSLKTYWLEEQYLLKKDYTHILPEAEGEPLRVASVTNMAPIAFQVDGEWYGMEIDLARELARKVHRPVEFKLYDGGSALMALKTGMVDVLLGCIFITPERELEYRFPKPYHEYQPAYFVKESISPLAQGSLWENLKKSLEKNLLVENRWKYITSGLWETVKITLLSILLGSVLGIGLCAMTRSRRKWLRTAAGVYNWFIAGIPMLVLLLVLFYVVFAKSGLSPTAVAVVAFAMNFASGASDVYGTSLDAVPHGQTEAGLALGFTRLQTFMHIVLPQAVKRGLPLYQGQCISILEGTSIVGYIAIQDLTRAGDIIRSRTFDAFVPLLVVTVIYFLLAWLLGALVKLATPKTKVL